MNYMHYFISLAFFFSKGPADEDFTLPPFFGPLSPFEEELSFALFPVAKTNTTYHTYTKG